MQPLKVYLDSSDYSRLCYARTDQERNILHELLRIKEDGLAEYFFSYCTIFEMLQEYDKDHRDDRINRAKFIQKLSSGKSFIFFMDLVGINFHGDAVGDWFPLYVKDKFNVDVIIDGLVSRLSSNLAIPYEIRSRIMTRSGLRRMAELDKNLLSMRSFDEQSMYHFSEKSISEDIVRMYLMGRMSKKKANDILYDMFRDVELFFYNYFDASNIENTFTKSFHDISSMLHNAIDIAYKTGTDSEIKNFDIRNYAKWMRENFPEHAHDIFNCYIHYNFKHQHLQNSDVADILHAMYLPFCDIWRGDNHFSNVLIRGKIDGFQKIVPKLSALPRAIMATSRRMA